MTLIRVLLPTLVVLCFVVTPKSRATLESQVRVQATPITTCDVRGFVVDQDPQGLNVRLGPGQDHAVIGNLPYAADTGVGVHISGSSGSWMRIDLAFEEGTDNERTLFKGVGWVYGPLIGLTGMAVKNGGTPLYQEAASRARLVTSVPGGESVIVKGCRGKWLFVEYKNVTGWAAPQTLCANSLTTCV